ncbi:MAG: ribonuclease P protein component 1 [Candidatus Odinarchaeia archaeon]
MSNMRNNYRLPLTIIGEKIKIIKSSDPTQEGIVGKIINETKNMLTLRKKNRVILIPKKNVIISMNTPNGKKILVEGKKLLGKPEDRIKKIFRRK